jgi:hypothetical protein
MLYLKKSEIFHFGISRNVSHFNYVYIEKNKICIDVAGLSKNGRHKF